MASLQRLLSIGYSFEDERVQNTDFGEPDSPLGHDLIYWDPSAALDDYSSSDLSGAVFLQNSAAREFEEDLDRRSVEFEEHLAAGKPIVIAIPPPQSVITSRRVDGVPTRFQWELVDLPSLLSNTPEFKPARGNAFEAIMGDAFAKFWSWAEDVSKYECYFVDPPGTPLLRITGTDRVVATAVQVGSGVVLYLPRLISNFVYTDESHRERKRTAGFNPAHEDFLDLLWGACQQFTGVAPVPKWSDAYLVPGEREAVHASEKAHRRLKAAEKAIVKQEEKIAQLRDRKILISGTGLSLERMVDQAFSALGFDVEAGQPGRTDRIVRRKRRAAVIEVKGKSKSASEKDAAQLEKWKSDFHAEYGTIPKGILVVNAWKGKRLVEREKLTAFPNQMLPYAAEQRKQCLLTGIQLLGLWLEAEAYPSRIDKLARSIMSCDGPYPRYRDWREVLELAVDESD